jgi:hypothetical protein
MPRAHGGTVMHRSSLWAVTMSGSHGARGNHDHDPEPMGHHAVGVVGVMEITSAVPGPMERRTYGMCGVIRFYAAVFLGLLLLSPALTDARDLGPLVSVWIWHACSAVMKRCTH